MTKDIDLDALQALRECAAALAYLAFNYDGSKLENLDPSLVESTCPAKTALIAEKRARDVIARIRELEGDAGKSAEAWISVGQRLPEDRQRVLLSIRTEYANAPASQTVGAAVYFNGNWISEGGHHLCTPSHWQPLPAAPSAGRAAPEGGKEGGE